MIWIEANPWGSSIPSTLCSDKALFKGLFVLCVAMPTAVILPLSTKKKKRKKKRQEKEKAH